MDENAYATLAALKDVKEISVRPCERRGSFVSYVVYLNDVTTPSKILFYVLVYEDTETTYSVPATRTTEMYTKGGLQARAAPMTIHSNLNNGNVLGQIDNKFLHNSANEAKTMWFKVRSEKDCKNNVYIIHIGTAGLAANIVALQQATGMKVYIQTHLDAFSKYCLVLAAIKILYIDHYFQLTPMPTNLNTSYGVDLPRIPPPPVVRISMTGLEFLRPLRKCFYRVVGLDPSATHYSEILDFDSHNLICVESSCRKRNIYLSHFNNAFGEAPFYSSRQYNTGTLDVLRFSGELMGNLTQYGTRIADVNGANFILIIEHRELATELNPNPSPWYRIEQIYPHKKVVGQISYCQKIGQLLMEIDIGLSVEHKALILASFTNLAIYTYRMRQRFVWQHLAYYPFKQTSASNTTDAPY